MQVSTVAQIGYRGMKKGKTVVVPGLQNRLLATLVRFVPRDIVTYLVRRVQEKA
jgi:short-subunit dehydrogenase